MEIWKDIIGYEWKYQISSLWKVKSLIKLKVLKPSILKYWHWVIQLSNTSKIFNASIHRLVAQHFIPNPLNLPCVLHKDETLDENWALYNWSDNLWWWTKKDNNIDCMIKWRSNNIFQNNHPFKWKLWKDSIHSKKVNQYTKDWEFIRTWDSITFAQLDLWISHHIAECCKWKLKSCWWFTWKYTITSE